MMCTLLSLSSLKSNSLDLFSTLIIGGSFTMEFHHEPDLLYLRKALIFILSFLTGFCLYFT
jgi:hypothetical protein